MTRVTQAPSAPRKANLRTQRKAVVRQGIRLLQGVSRSLARRIVGEHKSRAARFLTFDPDDSCLTSHDVAVARRIKAGIDDYVSSVRKGHGEVSSRKQVVSDQHEKIDHVERDLRRIRMRIPFGVRGMMRQPSPPRASFEEGRGETSSSNPSPYVQEGLPGEIMPFAPILPPTLDKSEDEDQLLNLPEASVCNLVTRLLTTPEDYDRTLKAAGIPAEMVSASWQEELTQLDALEQGHLDRKLQRDYEASLDETDEDFWTLLMVRNRQKIQTAATHAEVLIHNWWETFAAARALFEWRQAQERVDHDQLPTPGSPVQLDANCEQAWQIFQEVTEDLNREAREARDVDLRKMDEEDYHKRRRTEK